MDHTQALARLTSMTQADTHPQLTSDELDELLALAAIADADGREPGHGSWTPTYSPVLLRDSAAEGWRLKAGKVADAPEQVTADDATVRRGRGLYEHCMAMAAAYGQRSAASLTTITLTKRPPMPHGIAVGNAPEPDDPYGPPAGTWPHGAEARR